MINHKDALLGYYSEMFALFDCVHFNSSHTESIYRSRMPHLCGEVCSISHADIVDRRRVRSFDDKVLRLIFIGSVAPYKGFPLFEVVLRDLWQEGDRAWSLDVWGAKELSDLENVAFRGFFKSEELVDVFYHDALLVVPSVCDETFSLIVLEALSFGIPVLLSSTVGAKDIVLDYDSWFVFATQDELREKLRFLLKDRSRLRDFNRAICSRPWVHSLENHAKDILNLYKKQ